MLPPPPSPHKKAAPSQPQMQLRPSGFSRLCPQMLLFLFQAGSPRLELLSRPPTPPHPTPASAHPSSLGADSWAPLLVASRQPSFPAPHAFEDHAGGGFPVRKQTSKQHLKIAHTSRAEVCVVGLLLPGWFVCCSLVELRAHRSILVQLFRMGATWSDQLPLKTWLAQSFWVSHHVPFFI